MLQERSGRHGRLARQQAHDLVAVGRDVEREIHADRTSVVRAAAHQELEALVQHGSGIEVLRSGEPDRRGDLALQNLVIGLLPVVGELDAGAIVPEPRIEPQLDLFAALRFEVWVPDAVGRDGG